MHSNDCSCERMCITLCIIFYIWSVTVLQSSWSCWSSSCALLISLVCYYTLSVFWWWLLSSCYQVASNNIPKHHATNLSLQAHSPVHYCVTSWIQSRVSTTLASLNGDDDAHHITCTYRYIYIYIQQIMPMNGANPITLVKTSYTFFTIINAESNPGTSFS